MGWLMPRAKTSLNDLLSRDNRLLELSRSGTKGWFRDHVGRSVGICGCSLEKPDTDCDVGEALCRLRNTRSPERS